MLWQTVDMEAEPAGPAISPSHIADVEKPQQKAGLGLIVVAPSSLKSLNLLLTVPDWIILPPPAQARRSSRGSSSSRISETV